MKLQDFEGYVYAEIAKDLSQEEVSKIETSLNEASLYKLSDKDKKKISTIKGLTIATNGCTVIHVKDCSTIELHVYANTRKTKVFEKFIRFFCGYDTEVYSVNVLEEF